jgi:hypothetical protein
LSGVHQPVAGGGGPGKSIAAGGNVVASAVPTKDVMDTANEVGISNAQQRKSKLKVKRRNPKISEL